MALFPLLRTVLVALAVVACVRVADAQSLSRTVEITPGMVTEAIEGGVLYLKSLQTPTGGWNEEEVHIGGISSLCTLALLNAGESPQDKHVARALEFLRKLDPTRGPVQSTYVASLQTMVFCMAEPKRDAALIRRNVAWLIETQKDADGKRGAWGYPYGNGDPSNSQFALLALYEADQLGVEIPESVWKNASTFWFSTQNIDGSWPYTFTPPSVGSQSPGTGSMTCAGIVSLLISAEKSEIADARIRGSEFLPCQRQSTPTSKRISHAYRWMEGHFSVTRNPGNSNWQFYYLYGLERMGRMTEQRFIGGHDWYREGVAELLRQTKMTTRRDRILVHWQGRSSSEMMEPISTSLALLFLSKGRYPVLISKVQFTDESEDWNNHRHDLSHLARFVERRWKKHVTTQSVHLGAATVEDLLLSPVLYISGKDSPCPSDPETLRDYGQKLRDYVDRGGFIVAEAACPGGTFDAGFRKLLRAIFPEKDHQLYRMPPEHPIWRAEIPLDARFIRPMYCLDYGCRTCLVYLPGDESSGDTPSLSCLWELSPEMRRSAPHPQDVKDHIRAGLVLGVNILAYATERELKGKEQSFAPPTTDTAETSTLARGRLAMANLRHAGGCEVAPNALRNMLLSVSQNLEMRSGVLDVTIPITSPRLFEFPTVFMQGRYAFRLTDPERAQLRTYLERGGLLFANAVCASAEFDAAFSLEIRGLLPDAQWEDIPLTDPLCTQALGGFDLAKIRTRPAETGAGQEPLRLRGVRLNGRWAVVYSPWDISCAMEKFHSLDCRGYSTEDAARICTNVLLYSMQ